MKFKLQACGGTCFSSNQITLDVALKQAIVYLKASSTKANDAFGYAVALSGDGNTFAVGAYYEDSNAKGVNGVSSGSTMNSGAVYVFAKNLSGSFQQKAYIKANNTGAYEHFGISVDLSENGGLLAIGSYAGDTSFNNSGAVYVFSRDVGGNWTRLNF